MNLQFLSHPERHNLELLIAAIWFFICISGFCLLPVLLAEFNRRNK